MYRRRLIYLAIVIAIAIIQTSLPMAQANELESNGTDSTTGNDNITEVKPKEENNDRAKVKEQEIKDAQAVYDAAAGARNESVDRLNESFRRDVVMYHWVEAHIRGK